MAEQAQAVPVDVPAPVGGGVAPAVKKKPGRPKKKVAAAPIEVHGIVDQPANPEDLVELVYCNPILFKKILQMLKQFEVSEVEMIFDKQGLKISTKDHLCKSNIYTVVDGRCMNLYYCRQQLRVCVKRDNLERVLRTLGKNHHKFTLILKENYRSAMYIIIKNLEYNSESSYEIDMLHKPELADPAMLADNDTDYPLKFKFTSKHFKATINNIRPLSHHLTIQKAGNDSLQLTFDRAQKVNWADVYPDSEKINLKSDVDENDIFTVSVNIDYIKPFSNSTIGEDVFIAVHQTSKISFMTQLDKNDLGYAAYVKIFTEIIQPKHKTLPTA